MCFIVIFYFKLLKLNGAGEWHQHVEERTLPNFLIVVVVLSWFFGCQTLIKFEPF
jgi:hypothetical protein